MEQEKSAEAELVSESVGLPEPIQPFDQPIQVQPFDPSRFQAETARTLAYVLIAVLAGSYVLHSICIVILQTVGKKEAADSLTATFNGWLPAISGLAGSAVGFFISRAK